MDGGCADLSFSISAIIPFLLLCAVNLCLYHNRAEKRYGGHGFKYMNGFSSTDLSDYMVYAEPGKFVSLSHDPSLRIEDHMPVMDGVEACYPLYAAVAKCVYAGIGQIEKEAMRASDRLRKGKIVQA